MTLLEDIQNSAVDAKSDLGTLLRKCKILAARLGSQPLEDWLIWESNGYPDDVAVPDYRIYSLEVKGNFSGYAGLIIKNAPIPLACLPKNVRHEFQYYECRQSVASIEATLIDIENDRIPRVSTGDMALFLGQNVFQNYNCLESWAEVGTGHLVETLNSVRNRILDFALAVMKEAPNVGEPGNGPPTKLEPNRVTQIFNTTVYGGSANLVGISNDSAISFNIEIKDFSSLERVLIDNGVPNEDIPELRSALDSEPVPTTKEKFGPRVSAWIAKMMGKAAEGSWKISIGAAGSLLAQAIAKYYWP